MSASLAARARAVNSSSLPFHQQATTTPIAAPLSKTEPRRTPAAMLRTAALLRSQRLRLARLASLPDGAAICGETAATQHQTRSAAAAAAAPLPPAQKPLFKLFPSSGSNDERLVLGIESSCDDTAAAVVTTSGRVLSSVAASQQEVHARWGGVVPALARTAHRAAIDGVVSRALEQAGVTDPCTQLSAVAVTVGPGLSLCLDVGVRKARAVAREAGVPLVPVHHMEAHALVARLTAAAEAARAAEAAAESGRRDDDDERETTTTTKEEAVLPFPFLCLLVSGGHNLLALARGVGDYVLLGTTLDDAAGEALDKVARMLGLPAEPHGAAALERLALQGDSSRYPFPPPMKKRRNCDFSYAGLKTSARMAIERELAPLEKMGEEEEEGQDRQGEEKPAKERRRERDRVRADLAASFQRAAVDHLVERTRRGIEWAREALLDAEQSQQQPQKQELRHLVVAGGVAVNKTVRASLNALAEQQGLALVVPPPAFCTDNAVMVAWAGCERAALGLWQPAPEPLPRLSDEAYAAAVAAAREAREQVGRQYGEEAVLKAVASAAEGGASEGGASARAEEGSAALLVSREEAAALGEWIELRPRWPLTSEVAAGATGDVLSKKRADKMSPSLSDLTRRALGEGGRAALAAKAET